VPSEPSTPMEDRDEMNASELAKVMEKSEHVSSFKSMEFDFLFFS
jgi:hypothetical protein